jgi:hypothetical protein
MDPFDWFVKVLLLLTAPYAFLAAYRYAGSLFRRV